VSSYLKSWFKGLNEYRLKVRYANTSGFLELYLSSYSRIINANIRYRDNTKEECDEVIINQTHSEFIVNPDIEAIEVKGGDIKAPLTMLLLYNAALHPSRGNNVTANLH
jgi:hypothetical protein